MRRFAFTFLLLISNSICLGQHPSSPSNLQAKGERTTQSQTLTLPDIDTQTTTASSANAVIKVGYGTKGRPLVTLEVTRLDRSKAVLIQTTFARLKANLTITQGSKRKIEVEKSDTDLAGLAESINKSTTDFTAQVVQGESQSKLVVKSTSLTITNPLAITGQITQTASYPKEQKISPSKPEFQTPNPDYVIALSNESKNAIVSAAGKLPEGFIIIRELDGAVTDLMKKNEWVLQGASKPMAKLVIGYDDTPICSLPSGNLNADAASTTERLLEMSAGTKKCHEEFVLVRRIQQQDVAVGLEVRPNVIDVTSDLGSDVEQLVLINSRILDRTFPFEFDSSTSNTFCVYRVRKGCRLFSRTFADWACTRLAASPPSWQPKPVDNGIEVGPAKIFDVITLKKMLADAATQLVALSGFNAASINSAVGNLQGMSRDASFFTAQVTTTPLPGITSTASNALTTGSTVTGTTPVSPGVVTVQCPNGSVPNSSNGCTANPSGTSVEGSTSTITTTPSAATQQSSTSSNTQQTGTTTTLPSIAATVPNAPASTALNAPANIGVASSDILAEQVQLNAQLTTLRLLLQGALSDQYLTSESRAVGTRQQTTLGFAVSIDPPRQYKNAVAEVRIIVIPPSRRDAPSIMNLLPAEKTYNVARITSHQNAFGAGVVVQPVSVGANTGKAKDRLYLAKDTDTIALQYDEPRTTQANLPFWYRSGDQISGSIHFNPLDPCDRPVPDTSKAVVFGWQFRPVLGQEYVKGGMRQVFAQLALPVGLYQDYNPAVYVHTRWRAYDPKRQVLGEVYRDSCSIEMDNSGVTLLNPLLIRDLNATDIGNGQVRLTADGDFYASGMIVRSGATNMTPITFDGSNIEMFASLHDILQAGNLNVVSPNGMKQPFAILPDPLKAAQCKIDAADMTAIPRPDGSSRVHVDVTLGPNYVLRDDADGRPNPFVLVGGQVYGTQENPYTLAVCTQLPAQPPPAVPDAFGPDLQPATCEYEFTAPTSSLRNAQRFRLEDITWDQLKGEGNVKFEPSFTNLTVSSDYPEVKAIPAQPATPAIPASGGRPAVPANPAKPGVPGSPAHTVYGIAGFDLDNVDPNCSNPSKRCVHSSVGDTASRNKMAIISKNLAIIDLTGKEVGKAKTLRLTMADGTIDEKTVEWDLAFPKSSEDSGKLTANPQILYSGDSQTISVSGGAIDFSTLKDVLFDNKPYFTPTASSKPDASKLSLLITTDVTKAPGHKEFTVELVDDKGKPSKSTFSIDVVRR